MIHWLHGLVWGPALLVLLLGTGGYYSVQFRLFQLRGIAVWWRATAGSLLRKENAEPGSLSRIQSACMALAATIGTGNIVGVATALAVGGPGAVFWMWISALIGMMTAYAEVSLGIRYRERLENGRWFGGPCAYLSRGLGMPHLALLYGVFCLCASLGMGSMVQSNAIAQTFQHAAGVPPLVSAVIVTILAAGVILGGTRRIAWVNGRLIPLAAGIYALFSAAVLLMCRNQIPQVLAEIFRGALLPRAAIGGVGGWSVRQAFRYGVARGVFSNEAGLGTLAGLHGASSEDASSGEQGMWAMFEVFFDTVLICTLTALVILCALGGAEGLASAEYEGAVLAGACFADCLGATGEYLVSGAMTVFAFSTMIAWYFLGRQTLEAVFVLWERLRKERRGSMAYRTVLAGRGGGAFRRQASRVYLALYLWAVFLGCVSSLTAVWEMSDVLNGLMAFPNLLALFLLRRQVEEPPLKIRRQEKKIQTERHWRPARMETEYRKRAAGTFSAWK